MPFELLPLCADDLGEMAAIFNDYVEHSLATYTETAVSIERFEVLMCLVPGYPAFVVRDGDGAMAGFGILRPYSSIPAFDRTAELTLFLGKTFTGLGIGSRLLEALESEAVRIGVSTMISTVSSLNPQSLRFHRARGFVERGRLFGVGQRSGFDFDVVLFQKML
ncbi:MAG: N-acetyltransferase [Chlorobiaceae bacterium]|nr:N-acetyltransferase [Chlorobiaceae bacterium]